MDTSVSPPSPVSATQATDLLLVDASGDAAAYAAVLRSSYRVATTGSSDVARQFLRRQPPGLVIIELDLPGGDGVEICREAKKLTVPPPVLVTTVNLTRPRAGDPLLESPKQVTVVIRRYPWVAS